MYAVDIMFVYLSAHLIVGKVIDLSYLLSCGDALAELYVEESEFSVNRAYYVQLFLSLAYQLDGPLHVGEVVFHLVYLCQPVDAVLVKTLVD